MKIRETFLRFFNHKKPSPIIVYECIDVITEEVYLGGIGQAIFEEMLPLILLNGSSFDDKFKIYTEEFAMDENSEESDTFGVIAICTPDQDFIHAARYFKEDPDSHKIVEIKFVEYINRRIQSKKNKLKKLN